MNHLHCLWMLLLGGGLCLPCSQAQMSNDSIYFTLVRTFLEENPGPYLELAGLPLSDSTLHLLQDSTSERRLRFWSPVLTYSRDSSGGILRQFGLPYTLETPLLEEDTLRYEDQLSRKELRWVMQVSSEELQGRSSLRWDQWGRPITFGGIGLLLTTLLFYLRSP